MKKAPRMRVAGVGTAVGAVVIGSMLGLGCQPGTLPCDKEDWKTICAGDGGVTPANGGSTGSGGSSPTGGSGGGGGGAPDGGSSGGVTAATTITGCTAYPTLGDMDKFFGMRCGINASCHGAATFGNFKMANFWMMAMTAKAKVVCPGTPLADPADYTKGAIWLKTQATPMCADGTAAGGPMPMTEAGKDPAPLTADEKTCLTGFLKALLK